MSLLMKFHQNTHNYTEYDVNESVRNSYQTRSTLKHLGSFLEGRGGGRAGLSPQKGKEMRSLAVFPCYACPRSLRFCLFLQVRRYTKLLPFRVREKIVNSITPTKYFLYCRSIFEHVPSQLMVDEE